MSFWRDRFIPIKGEKEEGKKDETQISVVSTSGDRHTLECRFHQQYP